MDTVRVEGFSSSLRGRKLWVVGDENLIPNRFHVVEQELLGRGRRVLILADGRKHLPRWAQKMEWDAVFRIRDTSDLRLALTYVANALKPLFLIWLGEEPSTPILQKLTGHDVTFLGYGAVHPRGDWDAIYFPGGMEAARVEEVLIGRMGSAKLSLLNLRSVIPELRAVKAGLVWSSISEPEKSGSVYWYDVAEGEPPNEPLDLIETAHFLRELADRITSAK